VNSVKGRHTRWSPSTGPPWRTASANSASGMVSRCTCRGFRRHSLFVRDRGRNRLPLAVPPRRRQIRRTRHGPGWARNLGHRQGRLVRVGQPWRRGTQSRPDPFRTRAQRPRL